MPKECLRNSLNFFFLMFSNLPGLILVVFILSQISYNMVYLECAFNYGDLFLPSFKGQIFFLLYLSFILYHLSYLYFRDTSYPLFSVIIGRYLLSCNYFNAFILSTQVPALCLSPIFWALGPLTGGLADHPEWSDPAQASPYLQQDLCPPPLGTSPSSKTSFSAAVASPWAWPGFPLSLSPSFQLPFPIGSVLFHANSDLRKGSGIDHQAPFS